MLQTTIYRKQTAKYGKIPYSQVLTIKRICSTQQELVRHTAKIINQIQKHGSLIEQQIDKANLHEREQLLKEKKEKVTTNNSLSLKYNITFPKIK